MAKKQEKILSPAEQLHSARTTGIVQVMPGTEREVRIRHLEAEDLLRDAKMPDILTPLVVKSVYEDLSDRELRDFLKLQKTTVEDALKMSETIDYVVGKAIADNTKVADLTRAEKRWIFRLVMGPAELLITFRDDEEPDVEPVVEGDKVPSTTE